MEELRLRLDLPTKRRDGALHHVLRIPFMTRSVSWQFSASSQGGKDGWNSQESTVWIVSDALALLSQTLDTDANKDLVSRGPFYTCCKKQIRQHKLISPHPCLRVILTPTTTTTIYGSPDLVVHLQSPLFISTHEGKLQSRGVVSCEIPNSQLMLWTPEVWDTQHPLSHLLAGALPSSDVLSSKRPCLSIWTEVSSIHF